MSEMDAMTGAVYVQTNGGDRNRVLAFARDAAGALSTIGSYETGGAGDGVPHLTSQGSVILSGDGRYLLVTNAGSDDVSAFAVHTDGRLQLLATAAAGPAPKSVAERDGLVYVLSTGKPALTGFRLGTAGLEPIAGAEQGLSSAAADPAQVGFAPDGSTLVVTERGTDSVELVAVRPDGVLGDMTLVPSSGPTPYGFAFTSDGTLIVTEAFRGETAAAAASSYVLRDGRLEPVTRSLGNARSEICWAVVTRDDRFAFTTNFADGAVSRYRFAMGGALQLEDAIAGVTVEGRPGLRDEDLTRDGRFLYAIDADAGAIFGWSVASDGSLAPVGSWAEVPSTVAGLAAS